MDRHLTEEDVRGMNVLEKLFEKRKGDRRTALFSCVETDHDRRKGDRRK